MCILEMKKAFENRKHETCQKVKGKILSFRKKKKKRIQHILTNEGAKDSNFLTALFLSLKCPVMSGNSNIFLTVIDDFNQSLIKAASIHVSSRKQTY